jgi:hypothetical protein
MENSAITLEFKDGKFKGMVFELNTDDFDIIEAEDGDISLSYSVNYDNKNELVIKYGADAFLDEVGKLLIEGIEQEIEKLKLKEPE